MALLKSRNGNACLKGFADVRGELISQREEPFRVKIVTKQWEKTTGIGGLKQIGINRK